MVRGKSKFICDDCGHRFVADDVKFMDSTLTEPQQCPVCKSMHTRPPYPFGLNKWIYEKIWESIDRTRVMKDEDMFDDEE